MSEKFILSCGSTVDLPYSYVAGRDISVIFYHYVIDGTDYVDDMARDPEALKKFFALLDEGKLPSTSLINQQTYIDYFEELLQKGDVLHLAFTSGQSGSCQNAILAAEELSEKYPDKTIKVIDSTCSSSGYGLFVDMAADLRDEGKSLEEVAEWAEAHKNNVHHQFFSTDMTQFKRTGRVSGPAATIATILNICPIMRLDNLGRIIAYDKVRGKKKALARTLEEMIAHAKDGLDYDGKCFISNATCLEDAEILRDMIEEKFTKLKGKVRIFDIGTIISSHTGHGTVALFFYGDERLPE